MSAEPSVTTQSDREQTPSAGKIHTEVADGIGWIIIDNPERRNALSVSMLETMNRTLVEFNRNPDVSVIVLRGTGDAAFASGADISEFEGRLASKQAQRRFDEVTAAVFGSLRGMAKPSIAMIAGYCLGGGLAVALGTDIRIAADLASFAIPAARLGVGYPLSNTEALVSIVGPAVAADILFTGRQFRSGEAFAVGLVNRLVPLSELELTVRELAQTIVANAPLTIRAAKASIRAATQPDSAVLHSAAIEAINRCGESEDVREGQRAFMQKRAPHFRGR